MTDGFGRSGFGAVSAHNISYRSINTIELINTRRSYDRKWGRLRWRQRRLHRYSIVVLYERFSVLLIPTAVALDRHANGLACPILGDHGEVSQYWATMAKFSQRHSHLRHFG